MNEILAGAVSIALSIVGLAIIAVLVSNRANTAGVIQAASAGFGNDLLAAVSPVTGGGGSGGYLSYGSGGFGNSLGGNFGLG